MDTPTTATKEKTTQAPPQEAKSKGEVSVLPPPRLRFENLIEERFGIDRVGWKALVEAVYPTASSTDSVVLALSYCKQRNLDPFKRPVHLVPMWSTHLERMVDTVWPGISELRTTAHRTGEYAGCDDAKWGPPITKTFKGTAGRGKIKGRTREATITFPEWCQITVYRIVHGVRCQFVGPKVRWEEACATWADTTVPNDMWTERPEGQLEKCAEAASLRRAFPEETGGDLTAEEMAGRRIEDHPAMAHDITPPAALPPSTVKAGNGSGTIDAGGGERADATSGEILEDGRAPLESEMESVLGELRSALQACKTRDDIDAAVDSWSNKVGDLPPALERALEAAVEKRAGELVAAAKASPDPAGERHAEQQEAAAGAPATTGEKPAKPRKPRKGSQAVAGEPKPEGATGQPSPEKTQQPEKDAKPPAARESTDALKTRLRACKDVSALLACFENFVAPHLSSMPEEDAKELTFIKNQRSRLMGGK